MNLSKAFMMTMIFSLSGQVVAIDVCRTQAKSLSAKSSIKRISKTCIEEARNAASLNSELLDSSQDGSLSVFGHKNYVVVDNGRSKLSFIAGEMPGIKTILSVSVSADGEQIAILNKVSNTKREILVFSSDLLGNVSPMGVLSEESLIDASQISFSGSGDDIYILYPNDNQISKISAKGDSRNRSKAEQVFISKVYKSNKKLVQIQGKGSEIIMLSEDNQLSAVTKAGESKWVVNLSDKGINGANSFDLNGEEFEVMDNEGVKTMRHPASE